MSLAPSHSASAAASSSEYHTIPALRPLQVEDALRCITPYLAINELRVFTVVCRAWHASLPDIIFAAWSLDIILSGKFRWDVHLPLYNQLRIKKLSKERGEVSGQNIGSVYSNVLYASLICRVGGHLNVLDLHKSGFQGLGVEVSAWDLIFPEEKVTYLHLQSLFLGRVTLAAGENLPPLSKRSYRNLRRNCPNLTSLSLGCKRKKDLLALLKTPSDMENKLVHLTLLGCEDDEHVPAYSEEICTEFKKLQTLSIRCSDFGSAWLQIFTESLQGCPLTDFEIASTRRGGASDGMVQVLPRVASLLRIKILPTHRLTKAALISFASMPNLQRLEIGFTSLSNMTPSDIEEFARANYFEKTRFATHYYPSFTWSFELIKTISI